MEPMHPVYLGRVLHLSSRFWQAAYDKAIAERSTSETPETPVDRTVVTEVPEYDHRQQVHGL